MANTMTKEEHERNKRRRYRQMLGLVLCLLILIGAFNVLGAAIGGVAMLFDDTERKLEYEQRLQTLVMFDPLPFESLVKMEDSTARLVKEGAIWSALYTAQQSEAGLSNYQRDPDSEGLVIPAVEVDAAMAALYGPDFKMKHGSFEGVDMNYEYLEDMQGYLIPVTSQIGLYTPRVETLHKKNGKLRVTVGYIPTPALTGDYGMAPPSEPVKYMDYIFEKNGREYYLTALETSDKKPAMEAATSSNAAEKLEENAFSGVPSVSDGAASSALPFEESQAEDQTDSQES